MSLISGYDKYYLISWDAMEEFLMGEIQDIEIWGSSDCPECERIKQLYAVNDYKYYDISDLISGEEADVDAMVQLSFQNMRLPLIKVDGEWVDPDTVRKSSVA